MKIQSREFKFMVVPNGIAPVTAREDFHRIAADFGLPLSNADEGIVPTQPRMVCFVDTPEHASRAAGVVVRVRLRAKKKRVELTAKMRSSDRDAVAGSKLAFAEPGETVKLGALDLDRGQKVEADIKPGPDTLWSRSLRVRADAPEFPFLPLLLCAPKPSSLFDGLPTSKTLRVVRETAYHEQVFELGKWRQGSLKVEAALIEWYADEARTRRVLTEFSFRYKTKNVAGEPLFDVYERAQEFGWFDRKGQTKTAFAYGEEPA